MRWTPFRFKGFSPTHLSPTPIAEFHGQGIVVEPSFIKNAWLLIFSYESSQQLRDCTYIVTNIRRDTHDVATKVEDVSFDLF